MHQHREQPTRRQVFVCQHLSNEIRTSTQPSCHQPITVDACGTCRTSAHQVTPVRRPPVAAERAVSPRVRRHHPQAARQKALGAALNICGACVCTRTSSSPPCMLPNTPRAGAERVRIRARPGHGSRRAGAEPASGPVAKRVPAPRGRDTMPLTSPFRTASTTIAALIGSHAPPLTYPLTHPHPPPTLPPCDPGSWSPPPQPRVPAFPLSFLPHFSVPQLALSWLSDDVLCVHPARERGGRLRAPGATRHGLCG